MTQGDDTVQQRVKCAVQVLPKSHHDEVEGVAQLADGTREIRVRVRACADKGQANKATCKLMAQVLGLAQSQVRIVRGQTSHHKLLEIDIEPGKYEAWSESLNRV